MRCLGACSNRVNPLSCIRNPVEPVIVQDATAIAPSSSPGSRNRNVRAANLSTLDKLRRFRDDNIRNRTRIHNLDENNNSVSSVINNDNNNDNDNNHNTEQQTTSEDENAHVQNRRRYKLLRKLLCMKVPPRERDLTIDYVKGRDENITLQEKLEEAKFLVQCEIKKWKAEEEMAEREAITNEENVKILQSNYKALAQHKAMLLQELNKYQSIIETLKTDFPDIFVNDGHYMQIPLQRIEKHRAKYQARFKSRVLPELDIANIKRDKHLSEKVKTKKRLNITPEPTRSGREDPSKSVATFTIEGEEPRLDDEEFDHNEAVQAVWTQEPDTKKINFRGQSIIDPLLRKKYGGDDISDGWSIPRSWLKEEQPGPSNVQRIRVKKESPNTDREKVRVLRSTSISLSSPTPTPTPEKGAKINENEEEHAEEQKKAPIERPESCSSKTADELKKELEVTLVGFLTNLFKNQEEDLEEEYYSEAEDSESEEEEGPIYIGQIEDGINTPERTVNQNTLAPELQDCLSSPNKQTEDFPIEVYNTSSTDQVSSISSSILDACVAAVNEANKRIITPRTVEAIRDMLEKSTRVILRSQSQQHIRRVAFDVERALSNRSCDALTLIDNITNMIGREEQYSSDFELISDNESSTSPSESNCSTPKYEVINKEHPAPSDTKVNSSSSEDTITLVDIKSLLGRKVGITSDESETESQAESRSSGEKTLTPVGSTSSDYQFIAEGMASNSEGARADTKGDHSQRVITPNMASNSQSVSVGTEGDHSQRVITPNTLNSIRQNLQDIARVIPRTRSVQSIARAASNIKRTMSTTSRKIFSKFRRQNSVGIMPSLDVVNTS